MNIAFIREVGSARWVLRTFRRQLQKRVLRRAHTIVLPTGNRFGLPIDSSFASEVFVTGGDVDWGSEALLARMLIGTGCFLDIGANIGYYAVYFAPLVERVFAFEPDPRPRERLTANVAALPTVEAVALAAGRTSGSGVFALASRSELSHIAGPDEPGVAVAVVSLDDFVIERAIRVAAIKTDVEGFDLDVLRGAVTILRDHRPLVLSELQPGPDVDAFARSIGYDVFAFARDRRSRVRSFVKVDETNPAHLTFKMLFLVPRERAEELAAAGLPA